MCSSLSERKATKCQIKRKWKRRERSWAKNEQQKRQNSGVEYQTAWGTRATAGDCKCPIKYFQQVNSEYWQQIFDKLYALDSRDVQMATEC